MSLRESRESSSTLVGVLRRAESKFEYLICDSTNFENAVNFLKTLDRKFKQKMNVILVLYNHWAHHSKDFTQAGKDMDIEVLYLPIAASSTQSRDFSPK